MAKQQGYLLVDHRASPGLPEDIALAAGYDPKWCGEGKVYEADTLTCSHCKGVIVKNPLRTRDRHYCAKCSGHYICDGCAYMAAQPNYAHTPFEKKVEQIIRTELHQLQEGSPLKLLTGG
jgi:hypothetical protein